MAALAEGGGGAVADRGRQIAEVVLRGVFGSMVASHTSAPIIAPTPTSLPPGVLSLADLNKASVACS